MLRLLLCCLLLFNPDSRVLAGEFPAAPNDTQESWQPDDDSVMPVIADTGMGDDSEQIRFHIPARYISPDYNQTMLWSSFNHQYLSLFSIRAPPLA
ncbi:MAG: hypothetical protein LRY66_12210 [Saccharospirillaceae bacterium]|nr:hypothetical protein [Saccharospirillaceae bacterium]MCD8532080.1 hypothetical protein [Saccharospirillaceae bacterium]